MYKDTFVVTMTGQDWYLMQVQGKVNINVLQCEWQFQTKTVCPRCQKTLNGNMLGNEK